MRISGKAPKKKTSGKVQNKMRISGKVPKRNSDIWQSTKKMQISFKVPKNRYIW